MVRTAIPELTFTAFSRAERPNKVVQAAQEFESYLIKDLTSPLVKREDMADEPESEDGSGDALGEFAAAALGRAMSKAGGLGIARKLVSSLAPDRDVRIHPNAATRMYTFAPK